MMSFVGWMKNTWEWDKMMMKRRQASLDHKQYQSEHMSHIMHLQNPRRIFDSQLALPLESVQIPKLRRVLGTGDDVAPRVVNGYSLNGIHMTLRAKSKQFLLLQEEDVPPPPLQLRQSMVGTCYCAPVSSGHPDGSFGAIRGNF